MSNIFTNRYLDPTNDVAFKKLFTQKELLMHFLNTILKLNEEEKIVDLEYLPQEQVPIIGELKRTIVDVKVKDAKSNHYIVEMQNAYVEEFIKRVEYYAALAIVNQVETGASYAKLERVVVVCITKNHLALKHPDLDVISHHKVVEAKTGQCYFSSLSYTLVELERFTKKSEELKSIEDHWLYYFKCVAETNDIPRNLKIPEIKRAYASLERFNWTQAELDQYIKTDLYIQTEALNMDAMYKSGKMEEKMETAKTMFLEGLSMELISKCTKLSIEEIKSIVQELK